MLSRNVLGVAARRAGPMATHARVANSAVAVTQGLGSTRQQLAPLLSSIECDSRHREMVRSFHASRAVSNSKLDVAVTTLDKLANWARKGSLWPMTFGLA